MSQIIIGSWQLPLVAHFIMGIWKFELMAVESYDPVSLVIILGGMESNFMKPEATTLEYLQFGGPLQ